MILAIDIGNSNTTIGLLDSAGKLTLRAALSTNKNATIDQYAIDLMGVFQLYGAKIKDVTGTIIASVVPPVTAALSGAISLLTGTPPMLIGPGIKTGLNIKAEMHNQMGADIVGFSVAAMNKYPQPIIIVDMGTATTISVIKSSTFEGCAIAPGVRISLEALSERAAELPHISIEQPPSILGRNTIDSMRSGILYGSAAMIDSMIERMEEASAPAATVVATGSLAHLILPYCKRKILFDADLLMDGLYLIYQKNSTESKHRK